MLIYLFATNYVVTEASVTAFGTADAIPRIADFIFWFPLSFMHLLLVMYYWEEASISYLFTIDHDWDFTDAECLHCFAFVFNGLILLVFANLYGSKRFQCLQNKNTVFLYLEFQYVAICHLTCCHCIKLPSLDTYIPFLSRITFAAAFW